MTDTFPTEPRKVVQMNRHQRRLEDKLKRKANGTLKRAPVGYEGQEYEVTCEYAGNSSYVVGWANTKDGIAALCKRVLLHPAMANPGVRRLSYEERERLLAEAKKLPTK